MTACSANAVETKKGVGKETCTPREIETETDTVTQTGLNELNNQILDNSYTTELFRGRDWQTRRKRK
jgi:hypothetical protein